MRIMKITDERIEWHLSIPVCETLSGVIAHINHLSIPEMVALVHRFDCDNVVELSRVLRQLVKLRKKRR